MNRSENVRRVLEMIPVYPNEIRKGALYGKGKYNYLTVPADALLCEDGPFVSWISQEAKDEYLGRYEGRTDYHDVFIPDL